MAPKEFLSVPGAADGLQLNAWRITPPGFDSRRAWPVLVTQLQRPQQQRSAGPVGRPQRPMWHQLMAQRAMWWCAWTRAAPVTAAATSGT